MYVSMACLDGSWVDDWFAPKMELAWITEIVKVIKLKHLLRNISHQASSWNVMSVSTAIQQNLHV